jgi:hypothetical protein
MSEAKKQVKEEKSSNKVWILILAILLLAVNGIQGFFNFKQNNEIKAKEEIIVKKDAERDSLDKVLKSKIEELSAASDEILKLGGDTATLHAQIQELEKLSNELRNSKNKYYNMYMKVKGEIESANKVASDSKLDVERLKTQLAQLDSSNTTLKTTIVQKDQNISALEQEKMELSKQVAIASILKAENIHVIAISSKGKEKIGEVFKAKAISQIKITFSISENKVAQKNTKELFVRIIEPDGTTITDPNNGGGEFVYNNRSLFYTTSTSVLFNGQISPVTLNYTKGTPYKIGKQTIEIYSEGNLIGSGTFTAE